MKSNDSKVSHEEDRDAGYVFKIIMVALYLTFHLKCVGYFGDASNDQFFSKANVTVVTVISLIVRHVQSCSCNGYEISELIRDQKAIRVNELNYFRLCPHLSVVELSWTILTRIFLMAILELSFVYFGPFQTSSTIFATN